MARIELNLIPVTTNNLLYGQTFNLENKTPHGIFDIFWLLSHSNIRIIQGLYLEFTDMTIGCGTYGRVSFGLKNSPFLLVAIKTFNANKGKNPSYDKEKFFFKKT